MGKRLGQHFLTDKSTAKKIVEHACITKDDTVLEIGPGRGILTELILSKAGELIAVELDYKLANFLKSRFGKFRNFTLINKHMQHIGWDDIDLDYHTFELARDCLEAEGFTGEEYKPSHWYEEIIFSL